MNIHAKKPSDSRQELINALDQIITICFEIENRIDSIDDAFYLQVSRGREAILNQAISAKSTINATGSICPGMEDLLSTDTVAIDGMSIHLTALHWTIKNPLSYKTCGFLDFLESL